VNATAATAAVIAATATTLAFLVPQIIKLIRTGDSAGVSTSWPALGFASNVGWFVYMINQGLWASTVAPFGAAIGYAVTLWALQRTGRPLMSSYIRGAVFSVGLVAVTASAGWEALGVTLGLSFGVQLAPSLWTAFTTADPSGISPGTWWLGAAEAVLWGYYGLYHADAGIITFGVVAALGSVAMLSRFYATRSRVRMAT
jgi:uncharacterized protein with PQ loop repeat